MSRRSLRIALLSYRGNPLSGGQGVYVRYLSRALTEQGHAVEVLAGQPYPQLDDGVSLTKVPSLDLYRPEDPLRRPGRDEYRDWVDVLEYAQMCTASFPEPLTFGLRAARILGRRASDFDVVHDNQSLGYGLLRVARRLPVVATVHHPVAVDRRLELADAQGWKRRTALRRWYAFTRMQARVASRLCSVITVSEAARADVVRELRVDRRRIAVVHNGVDHELFRPLPHVARVPGRILAVSSADVPLKGLSFLIEAVAKLRTERDVELVVVGRSRPGGAVERAIARFGVEDAVSFRSGIDSLELVELYAGCEVAVVPSLYEGFSLPAVEAMSCGVPLVSTTGGALPEVVGPDGEAALAVAPGDAGALAGALERVMDDPGLRARLGESGRSRVLDRFTWRRAAAETAAVYEDALARC